MLCQACKDAFREDLEDDTPVVRAPSDSWITRTASYPAPNSPYFRAYHHSVHRLKQSALRGCQLCRLLWAISPDSVKDLCTSRDKDTNEWPACYMTMNRSVFTTANKDESKSVLLEYKYRALSVDASAYVLPEKRHLRLMTPAAIHPLMEHGAIEPSTGSDKTWNFVKACVRKCRSEHTQCSGKSLAADRKSMPRRLIEVCPSGTVKLRNVDEIQSSTPVEYIALSHCWGSITPETTLVLTTSSAKKLYEGIPVTDLPKTFFYAAFMTRRFTAEFGVKYLWIDSLCIKQDSIDDWRHESTVMGQIYQNAFCTLAATASRDGSGGLFFPRDAQTVMPCEVAVIPRYKKGEKKLYCVDPSSWQRNISEAPLNTRSWVFQERLLSSRVVHFAADQIFWECSELEACEAFPQSVPDDCSDHFKKLLPLSGMPQGPQVDFAGGRGLYGIWDHVMKTYSSGNLSRNTDRLIALSGIAQKMKKIVIPHDTYLAGLWKLDLAFELLWDVTESATSDDDDTYVAPSWSWASKTNTVPCPKEIWAAAAKGFKPFDLISAEVETIGADQTAQVRSGSIRVSGGLHSANIVRAHQPGASTPAVSLNIHSDGVYARVCRTDSVIGFETAIPSIVYCLPILSGKEGRLPRYRGLILVASHRREEYKRYGTFEALSPGGEILTSPNGRRVITIV